MTKNPKTNVTNKDDKSAPIAEQAAAPAAPTRKSSERKPPPKAKVTPRKPPKRERKAAKVTETKFPKHPFGTCVPQGECRCE